MKSNTSILNIGNEIPSDLSVNGVVQSDLLTVKVYKDIFPIYYQYLIYPFKEGESIKGRLEIEYNIKVGSTVSAPGLGHVIVSKINNGLAYFRDTKESIKLQTIHSLDPQSVVFKPEKEVSNTNLNDNWKEGL